MGARVLGDPVAIYQGILDRLSSAALHGDMATCLRLIRRPFRSSTLAVSEVIETEEALEAYMMSFTDWLRAQRATDYIRLARDAAYLSRDRIEGTHYTHVISGGQRVIPPYASRMTIVRSDEVWQVAEAVHALANVRFPIRRPETTPRSEALPIRLHG